MQNLQYLLNFWIKKLCKILRQNLEYLQPFFCKNLKFFYNLLPLHSKFFYRCAIFFSKNIFLSLLRPHWSMMVHWKSLNLWFFEHKSVFQKLQWIEFVIFYFKIKKSKQNVWVAKTKFNRNEQKTRFHWLREVGRQKNLTQPLKIWFFENP